MMGIDATNPTWLSRSLEQTYIPHLRTQFEHARPILFTGAGFSLDARNRSGSTLPTTKSLRKELWSLCFPGTEFEDEATLPDLFQHALDRHRRTLSDLLIKLLSVDGNSLPSWYRDVFAFPWARCYTLNVDDLAAAADRAFDLPRGVLEVSATRTGDASAPSNLSNPLEVIHLNGALDDIPDHVTFSVRQYASRSSAPDPWYTGLVTDLMSHPIVAIGSSLDEPPLWQHLERRGARGGRELGELRPRSYLVTPSLSKPRQALLADLNVAWIPMTGEEFSTRVLGELSGARDRGLRLLRARHEHPPRAVDVPEVADLATSSSNESEFLHGNEPIWSDLRSGRAIRRDSDGELWIGITAGLKTSANLVVVTGTAGSGKSTALMRACLRLSARGERVAWIDRDTNVSAPDVLRYARDKKAPRILAIDDADTYGPGLASTIRELADARDLLILVALRAGQVDRALNPLVLGDLPVQEFPMPPLTDSDIDGLLSVLDKHNRLGALKGMLTEERRNVLRRKCGRQLLVAMIEATSGRKFEEKAIQELTELQPEMATPYGIIAVAHAHRLPLQQDEVLLALGDASNEALNGVRKLVRRHIVTQHSDGRIQARHRVIAEVVHDQLQEQGRIGDALEGLAFMAATKVSARPQRAPRARRMLRAFIKHKYLSRSVGAERARALYGRLESLLEWEFHYWLQRGSLEVAHDNLESARQFLAQARSIRSRDPYVDNEWAYLLFREAVTNPGATDSERAVDEATEILVDLIAKRGKLDSYPYHVLGSQGLAWSRRGLTDSYRKGQYLQRLRSVVEEGLRKHPGRSDLKQLRQDIEQEYLGIVLPKQERGPVVGA